MIKNRASLIKSFPKEKILIDLAEEALRFLQPDLLIKNQVSIEGSQLLVQGKKFDLEKYRNIYVVGAGKATYQMAKTMNELLKGKIKEGYINVPLAITKKIGTIVVNKAGHPFPDKNGLKGAKRIIEILEKADERDLVVCLISGGGSALLPTPIPPLTLEEKIDVTKKLLKSTANIDEINAVRKHLSLIKGGRMANIAFPATVLAMYISDVPYDRLDSIASGPTVIDKSTSKEVIKILDKYKIRNKKITEVVLENETPKKLDGEKVFNFIIGSNKQAIEHLSEFAKNKGYNVITLPYFMKGEAKKMPKKIINKAKPNTILIAGGETVVKIKGKGMGGRNQEMALASILNLKTEMSFLTLATDGVDGITYYPVAGALVTKKIKIPSQEIRRALANNDSFSMLKNFNCLLKTGPSGTNVGDISILKN